MFPFLP